MKSLRQLLRQPVKSMAGILLLALAGGLLCANVGQYAVAVHTRRQLMNDYTTAALTTNKYKEWVVDDVSYFIDNQPQEIQAFLTELETGYPELIRRVDRLGMISGYCPVVTPLNYVQAPYIEYTYSESTIFSEITNEPYTTAVLAVTLEEIGSAEYTQPLFLSQYTVSLVARVDQVVFLQEGFQNPVGRTLYFTLAGRSEEEIEALGLQVGERYLIYGNYYYDNDWHLRRDLCAWFMDVSIEELDWDKITLLEDIEDEELLEFFHYKNLLYDRKTVAVYGEATREGNPYYMAQYELDMVNSSTLVVYLSPAQRYSYYYVDPDFTFSDSSELMAHIESEEYQEASRAALQEFSERYKEPSIAHLDGTVEEFLAGQEGALWKEAMEQADINNHALPVLATTRLESVVQFIRGDAVIAQGRGFTQEEYAAGARVCVLSESLAAANGLSVGDRIPLSLYSADPNYRESSVNPANPAPAHYSPVLGFAAPEEEYEIVGLYRQTDEWRADTYAFLPNTVFVPDQAVTAETLSNDSGIFQTIVLYNGTQADVEALLEEAGFPGLFVYYDQGYSKIAPQLESYFKNVQISLVAGIGAWLVIFLLFLFLFPLAQKKTVRRMWALGARPGQITGHVLASGMGLAVPGTVLGGLLGYAFLQNALKQAAAETQLPLSVEAWIVPMLIGVQVGCCLAATALCGVFLARRGAGEGVA